MSKRGLPILRAGDVIAGRYRVDRVLGQGGMGAVYEVRHIHTEERLALKALNPMAAKSQQAIERFRIEARAPIKIGGENVVRVTDADVVADMGNVPIVVMEYLEGRDLGSELARRGALPAGQVCLYLSQIARALDRAHAAGIVHRDLKPANLFLTKKDDGSPLVKILDFGIAKVSDGDAAEGAVFGLTALPMDNLAHGGGLVVGAGATWILAVRGRRVRAARAAFGVLVALLVLGAVRPWWRTEDDAERLATYAREYRLGERYARSPRRAERFATVGCRAGSKFACWELAKGAFDSGDAARSERAAIVIQEVCAKSPSACPLERAPRDGPDEGR